MELTQEEKIEEVVIQLKAYSKIQLELFKLRAIEKVAVSASYLISHVVPLLVFILSVIFLSTAAAFYLSQLVGGIVMGFALVGGFYLMVTILFVLFRKTMVETSVKNKIIHTLSDPSK